MIQLKNQLVIFDILSCMMWMWWICGVGVICGMSVWICGVVGVDLWSTTDGSEAC